MQSPFPGYAVQAPLRPAPPVMLTPAVDQYGQPILSMAVPVPMATVVTLPAINNTAESKQQAEEKEQYEAFEKKIQDVMKALTKNIDDLYEITNKRQTAVFSKTVDMGWSTNRTCSVFSLFVGKMDDIVHLLTSCQPPILAKLRNDTLIWSNISRSISKCGECIQRTRDFRVVSCFCFKSSEFGGNQHIAELGERVLAKIRHVQGVIQPYQTA